MKKMRKRSAEGLLGCSGTEQTEHLSSFPVAVMWEITAQIHVFISQY